MTVQRMIAIAIVPKARIVIVERKRNLKPRKRRQEVKESIEKLKSLIVIKAAVVRVKIRRVRTVMSKARRRRRRRRRQIANVKMGNTVNEDIMTTAIPAIQTKIRGPPLT